MANQRIETGKIPQIFIEMCEADLVIQGWGEPAVQLKGDFEVTEIDKGLRVSSTGDLRVNLPSESQVFIAEVAGDAAIKHVRGELSIDRVQGDVILVDLVQVQLTTIHGDLAARGVELLDINTIHGDVSVRNSGNLGLKAVYGDVVGRRVNGSFVVGEASGDIDLRAATGDVRITYAHRDVNLVSIGGEVSLTNVDGDIRLRGELVSGDHALNAMGDIVIRWPVLAPLNLVARARRIDNRLPLEDIVEKDGQFIGRIGTGKTHLSVSAGGRVILKEADMINEKWDRFGADEAEIDFEMAMGNLGLENIASRIETEVNTYMTRFAREMESRFGPEFGRQIGEKIARHTERAAERFERAAEQSRRRSESRGRSSGFSSGAATTPAPRKSASTEEQLKILKMVESGAITSEEAGMLLEALEG